MSSYQEFLAAKARRHHSPGVTIDPADLHASLHGIGCELKPSYYQTAVANLRKLDEEMSVPTLFDGAAS